MQWTSEPNGGFTEAGTEPWLPIGDTGAINVADQMEDHGSTLQLTRDLIALRKQTSDLVSGDYRTLSCAGGCWVWQRGESTAVALNLGDHSETLDLRGRILLHTHGEIDSFEGSLKLGGHQGIVVAIDSDSDT